MKQSCTRGKHNHFFPVNEEEKEEKEEKDKEIEEEHKDAGRVGLQKWMICDPHKSSNCG